MLVRHRKALSLLWTDVVQATLDSVSTWSPGICKFGAIVIVSRRNSSEGSDANTSKTVKSDVMCV